ncbi:hypothetical protein KOM07_08930 [Lentilactobacillus sp. G22-6]|uniref:hypothetical protein n=1 Tax=Lentilactobacillus dabitei TaxID=2831523 RepID=UPI001C275F16|nr:hypothetical protein [Lentilactobacillus dabitei]MBU9789656.1 hypothetical protein [Lentilactobacillus dabitei]
MTYKDRNSIQLMIVTLMISMGITVAFKTTPVDAESASRSKIQITRLQKSNVFVSNDANIYNNLHFSKIVYHVDHNADYLPVISIKRAVIKESQHQSSYIYVISTQHNVRGWVDAHKVAGSC